MTPLESRGLLRGGLLLLALSVLRLGVVWVTGEDPVSVEGKSDLEQLLEESLEAKAEADRRTAPLGVGETLDPNRSEEEELDRLPGVGPATAEAVIQTRRVRGGFTRAEDLLEVTGIGPATLKKIRPFLDFSQGVPLALQDPLGGSGNPAPRRTSPRRATGLEEPNPRAVRPSRVDVNRAGSDELETLPGIGPELALRIIEDRRKTGLFLKPEDLLRIRGIGPVTLEKIRDLILPRG
jgi:competence protein ComEA